MCSIHHKNVSTNISQEYINKNYKKLYFRYIKVWTSVKQKFMLHINISINHAITN